MNRSNEKKYTFTYQEVTVTMNTAQLKESAYRGKRCQCNDCMPCCAFHFVTSNDLTSNILKNGGAP